jgi:GTPase Era involved in 16S rRNA processing
MMVEVREALEGCDLVLLIMDATARSISATSSPSSMLKHSGDARFLVLNKVDLLRRGGKGKLLPLIDEYKKLHRFRPSSRFPR